VRAPLGRVCGARSGDKGGNANVGLWTRTDREYAWLREHLTVARFRELLPEAATLAVQRHELPNLRALNFVVVGLLGEGVAASTRPDPQAKGLGEYLRSRVTDIPAGLLADHADHADHAPPTTRPPATCSPTTRSGEGVPSPAVCASSDPSTR